MVQKKIKFLDIHVNNTVISKLVKQRKTFWYLDTVVRSLILILPKMSGYVKTFKVKDWDNYKNNKLMYFCIDHDKLLVKCKTIWT